MDYSNAKYLPLKSTEESHNRHRRVEKGLNMILSVEPDIWLEGTQYMKGSDPQPRTAKLQKSTLLMKMLEEPNTKYSGQVGFGEYSILPPLPQYSENCSKPAYSAKSNPIKIPPVSNSTPSQPFKICENEYSLPSRTTKFIDDPNEDNTDFMTTGDCSQIGSTVPRRFTETHEENNSAGQNNTIDLMVKAIVAEVDRYLIEITKKNNAKEWNTIPEYEPTSNQIKSKKEYPLLSVNQTSSNSFNEFIVLKSRAGIETNYSSSSESFEPKYWRRHKKLHRRRKSQVPLFDVNEYQTQPNFDFIWHNPEKHEESGDLYAAVNDDVDEDEYHYTREPMELNFDSQSNENGATDSEEDFAPSRSQSAPSILQPIQNLQVPTGCNTLESLNFEIINATAICFTVSDSSVPRYGYDDIRNNQQIRTRPLVPIRKTSGHAELHHHSRASSFIEGSNTLTGSNCDDEGSLLKSLPLPLPPIVRKKCSVLCAQAPKAKSADCLKTRILTVAESKGALNSADSNVDYVVKSAQQQPQLIQKLTKMLKLKLIQIRRRERKNLKKVKDWLEECHLEGKTPCPRTRRPSTYPKFCDSVAEKFTALNRSSEKLEERKDKKIVSDVTSKRQIQSSGVDKSSRSASAKTRATISPKQLKQKLALTFAQEDSTIPSGLENGFKPALSKPNCPPHSQPAKSNPAPILKNRKVEVQLRVPTVYKYGVRQQTPLADLRALLSSPITRPKSAKKVTTVVKSCQIHASQYLLSGDSPVREKPVHSRTCPNPNQNCAKNKANKIQIQPQKACVQHNASLDGINSHFETCGQPTLKSTRKFSDLKNKSSKVKMPRNPLSIGGNVSGEEKMKLFGLLCKPECAALKS